MQHLFDPRALIDGFERTLVNAFSPIQAVQAIWIRETPRVLTNEETAGLLHPPGVARARSPKTFTRIVWLQLARMSPTALRQIEGLTQELQVRVHEAPFELEVHVIVDDFPPAVVLPACIFKRGSGRI